jgi:energy-coupling factor transporter ATP-binding protein EcfA2
MMDSSYSPYGPYASQLQPATTYTAYKPTHYQQTRPKVQSQTSTRKPTPSKPPVEEDPEDIVIAVMGATGSGKSTFINLVSGSSLAVGRGLRSCTSKVETANTFNLFGRLVTLVDTPGFDDTTVSDTDILKMIAVYLSTTYEAGLKLSGVIYMHRISDFRVGGIAKRNFNMFRKLCGDESLKNVVLVTNMWGQVDPEIGNAREEQLRTDELLFKPVFDKGAMMMRHDNTVESAEAILRHLVNKRPRALRIQRELVDEGKDIMDTSAGVELDRELAEMAKKHKEELAEVMNDMEEALATKDMETKKELEEVRESLLKNIQNIENDRERLSKEYERDRQQAEEKLRTMEADLEEEKRLRAERQKEIDGLQTRMNQQVEASAAERAQWESRMDELRREQSRRRRRGLFGAIGAAIDSIFGL